MKGCIKCFDKFMTENELSQELQIMLTTIIDQLTQIVSQSFQKRKTKKQRKSLNIDEDESTESTSLMLCLQRLEIISQRFFLEQYNEDTIKHCLKIIRSKTENSTAVSNDVNIVHAIKIYRNTIMWRFNEISSKIESLKEIELNEPTQQEKTLLIDLIEFSTILEPFLNFKEDSQNILATNTFINLCELLILFSPALINLGLSHLVYYPPSSILEKITQVFKNFMQNSSKVGNSRADESVESIEENPDQKQLFVDLYSHLILLQVFGSSCFEETSLLILNTYKIKGNLKQLVRAFVEKLILLKRFEAQIILLTLKSQYEIDVSNQEKRFKGLSNLSKFVCSCLGPVNAQNDKISKQVVTYLFNICLEKPLEASIILDKVHLDFLSRLNLENCLEIVNTLENSSYYMTLQTAIEDFTASLDTEEKTNTLSSISKNFIRSRNALYTKAKLKTSKYIVPKSNDSIESSAVIKITGNTQDSEFEHTPAIISQDVLSIEVSKNNQSVSQIDQSVEVSQNNQSTQEKDSLKEPPTSRSKRNRRSIEAINSFEESTPTKKKVQNR